MSGSGPGRLFEQLQELRAATDDRLRREWRRSLPFADGLFDRWERAERLGFGSGTSVYDSSSIFGDVVVGEDSWIGPNTLLDGSGGQLQIGSHCSISAGVQIYTHDTVLRSLSMGECDRHTGSVSIGSGCHIGALAVIAAGVTIGDRVVVGAHSFVNRDIPTRTVVGGVPARRLGSVVGDGEEIRLVMDRPSHRDFDEGTGRRSE